MHKITQRIQYNLNENSVPQKARWLENYVKHDILSLGVGIPVIREIVKNTEKDLNWTSLSLAKQETILDELVMQKYTEDKLAAIIYIQLFWGKIDPEIKLKRISSWFDQGWISDWNVCDWLCVRILSPILDRHTNIVIPELYTWNKDSNLWKARASLVPFAQAKTILNYRKEIKELSETLIMREERFSKTAVGWVLREFSKHDKEFVRSFIKEYQSYVTAEVIKNATKYFK